MYNTHIISVIFDKNIRHVVQIDEINGEIVKCNMYENDYNTNILKKISKKNTNMIVYYIMKILGIDDDCSIYYLELKDIDKKIKLTNAYKKVNNSIIERIKYTIREREQRDYHVNFDDNTSHMLNFVKNSSYEHDQVKYLAYEISKLKTWPTIVHKIKLYTSENDYRVECNDLYFTNDNIYLDFITGNIFYPQHFRYDKNITDYNSLSEYVRTCIRIEENENGDKNPKCYNYDLNYGGYDPVNDILDYINDINMQSYDKYDGAKLYNDINVIASEYVKKRNPDVCHIISLDVTDFKY